jgi:hypothetical protein
MISYFNVVNVLLFHFEKYNLTYKIMKPISVTALSKVRVYGCSLAGIVSSNPAFGMDVSLC